MAARRILIVGTTKENSYELRNVLDDLRWETEIAMNSEVCKTILSAREMDLLILHTEALTSELDGLFEFLYDEGMDVPMMLCGEEASALIDELPVDKSLVTCFDKPYPVERMIEFVEDR